MQSHSTRKSILAVVLCVAMAATGCTAQWISVALADLPVLTQMALNIATLAAAVQGGQQLSPSETNAIQNISSAAYGGLNSLQTLYAQYKANPDATTLQKIQDVIAAINQQLPSELQAAHVSDPALQARVAAGVNLILTTVQSFAALMPQASASTAQKLPQQKASIPNVKNLKKQWNQQVCAPTGNASVDAVLAQCAVQ